MSKLGSKEAIRKTAYWNGKGKEYFFDRSAQFVLNGKQIFRNGKTVAVAAGCSSCSCGTGGCGNDGGCDAY